MVETKRIDVPLQKLIHQEPTEVSEHFLEFYFDRIRWVGEFYADEDKRDEEGEYDKSLPRENVFNLFDITIFKNKIGMVQMIYLDKVELFKVEIEAAGTDVDITIYFKSHSKAERLKDDIIEWLIS